MIPPGTFLWVVPKSRGGLLALGSKARTLHPRRWQMRPPPHKPLSIDTPLPHPPRAKRVRHSGDPLPIALFVVNPIHHANKKACHKAPPLKKPPLPPKLSP